MSIEVLEVGDTVNRDIYKNGYWVNSVRARVLELNTEKCKVKLSGGEGRAVWVNRSTVSFRQIPRKF